MLKLPFYICLEFLSYFDDSSNKLSQLTLLFKFWLQIYRFIMKNRYKIRLNS